MHWPSNCLSHSAPHPGNGRSCGDPNKDETRSGDSRHFSPPLPRSPPKLSLAHTFIHPALPNFSPSSGESTRCHVFPLGPRLPRLWDRVSSSLSPRGAPRHGDGANALASPGSRSRSRVCQCRPQPGTPSSQCPKTAFSRGALFSRRSSCRPVLPLPPRAGVVRVLLSALPLPQPSSLVVSRKDRKRNSSACSSSCPVSS